MPKVYSQDLREKAVAAVDRGVTKSKVIRMFNISRDSLDRWLKRREANVQIPEGSIPSNFTTFWVYSEVLSSSFSLD